MVTKDSTEKTVLALAVDPDNSKKLYAAIEMGQELSFYTSDIVRCNRNSLPDSQYIYLFSHSCASKLFLNAGHNLSEALGAFDVCNIFCCSFS